MPSRSTQTDPEIADRSSAEHPNQRASRQDKVERVLRCLRDAKLSLTDFLIRISTIEDRGRTAEYYRRQILDAVFNSDETREHFNTMSFIADGKSNYVSIQMMRKEMQLLQSLLSVFGAYDAKFPWESVDITEICDRISIIAPVLTQLWLQLTAPVRERGGDRDSYEGRFLMFCSLLLFTRAPRNSNLLARTIGIYLQSLGVKRRALEVLAGLGVTEGYRTIMNERNAISEIAQEGFIYR